MKIFSIKGKGGCITIFALLILTKDENNHILVAGIGCY